MYRLLQQRLKNLEIAKVTNVLGAGIVGLEREVMRVNPAGEIARTPHPQALGSALTHPHITTDYSEALLEFITPPYQDKNLVMQFLLNAHKFVYEHLAEERLWPASMPGILRGDESIPIANYGNSNAGKMKNIYRRGLGLRYGRSMQAIAGVHFNYSLPLEYWPIFLELEMSYMPLSAFVSECYMGLIRNLQRYGWLIPYLFGASPVVCKSFLGERRTNLPTFTPNTFYYPYATSLRMGDIGYQNSMEEGRGFKANYDSLDTYIRGLTWAIETPCLYYEKIGIFSNGEYQQLSTHVLQIENEHYSTIRPKQILNWLEKPSLALRHRGIRYVELRSLDVNIFEPTGVALEQLYFLETLLVFCLLNISPRISAQEAKEINTNQIEVAHRGREPGLKLRRQDIELTLHNWSLELLDEMLPVAALLDEKNLAMPHTKSLYNAKKSIFDPELTPSARILREMRNTKESFVEYALRLSWEHRAKLLKQEPLTIEQRSYFEDLAHSSHQRQQVLEDENNQPFAQFLEEYFAQS